MTSIVPPEAMLTQIYQRHLEDKNYMRYVLNVIQDDDLSQWIYNKINRKEYFASQIELLISDQIGVNKEPMELSYTIEKEDISNKDFILSKIKQRENATLLLLKALATHKLLSHESRDIIYGQIESIQYSLNQL